MRQLFTDRLMAGCTVVLPRAIQGSVRAETDATAILRGLQTGFEDFKARHDARVAAIEGQLDTYAVEAAATRASAGDRGRQTPEDAAYSRDYAAFFRTGDEGAVRAANSQGQRASIRAAMSEGTNSAGGYLAPVEWDRKIVQQQRVFSPMRRLAMVVPTTVRGYSTVWSDGGWGTGWVGETAPRPQTSNPTLSPINFIAGQLYAMPAVTQDLLDDGDFDAQDWLANEVGQVFAVQEGLAFLSGSGVNMPQGLLTYITGGTGVHPGGVITQVPSLAVGKISGDDLYALIYSLTSVYRPGATFLMSSVTAAAVSTMKDAQGHYLWQPSFQEGRPPTLLGYPVETDEGMPGVASGSIAIAFGNFARAYVINDRLGTTILRDPYSNKPYVNFYTRKRVGGGVRDPNAMRFLTVQ